MASNPTWDETEELAPKWDDTVSPNEAPMKQGWEGMADFFEGQGPLLEAQARGVAQGATFNMADEIEALARSGLQGTDYDKAISEIRNKYKQSEEKEPVGFGIGNVAGAVGTGFGLTKALSSVPKVGKMLAGTEVLQGAKIPARLAANTALTTAQAVPLIMASKFGASEKSGIEALDESVPTGLETLLAPATYLGVKGISNLPAAKDKVIQKVEDFLGSYYKSAKKAAEQGIELKGEGAALKLSEQAASKAKDLRESLESTFDDNIVLTKQAKLKQQQDLKELLDRNKKLEESFKQEQDLTKKIQTEQNEATLKQLEIKRANLGEKTEQFLDQSRQKISKAYDNLDSELEASGFVFNNSEGPIANFTREVDSNPNLTEESKKQVLKALEPFGNEVLDIKQFRKLKDTLNKLGSNKDYEVASLAKKTYGSINQDLVSQLDSNPDFSGLSEKLKKVNDQYSAFRRYDDTFTGKGYETKDLTDTQTLRLLKQFGGDSAEDIQKTKDVTGLLQRINPDEAPAQLSQMGQLSSEIKQAKNFTPIIPQENPELIRLQQLIEQTKSRNVEVPISSQQQLSQDIFSGINNQKLTTTKTMDKILERGQLDATDRRTVDNIISEFVDNPEASMMQLQSRLTELNLSPKMVNELVESAQLLDTSRMVNAPIYKKIPKEPPAITGDIGFATQQAAKGITRSLGGPQAVAANIGRFAGNVSKNPGIISKFYNKVSAPLGTTLRAIAEEPSVQKRAALTFAMMQKPEYRQELQEAGAFDDENSGR